MPLLLLSTLERLVELMATNPARIFGLTPQPDTYVLAEVGPRYALANAQLQTKCGWTPFAGVEVAGRVVRTVLRDAVVYDGTAVLAAPGSGRVLYDTEA